MKKLLLPASAAAVLALCLILARRPVPTVSVPFTGIAVSDAGGEARPGQAADGASLTVELLACGTALCAAEDGTVLLPVLSEEDLAVRAPDGTALSRTAFAEENGLKRCTVYAEKDGRTGTLRLEETGIAVAQLNVDVPAGLSGDPVTEKNRSAAFSLFRENGGRLICESVPVSVKLHGRSSVTYPKKSYTLTCRTASGSKTAASLSGFSADVKFVLNSMYEDDLKLRDALSLGLYADMAGEDAPHLGITYCELFLNGGYEGLYAFQQTPTPTSLKLADGTALVKIEGLFHYDLLDFGETAKVVRDLADGSVSEKLYRAFTAVNDGAPDALSAFDAANLADYTVFTSVIASEDNYLNNILFIYDPVTELFSLCAYDCDMTFGMRWKKTKNGSFAAFSIKAATRDAPYRASGYFSPLALLYAMEDGTFKSAVDARYADLRDTLFSEEALLSRIAALHALLDHGGALGRDRERWPETPFSETTEDIEAFVRLRLEFLDGLFTADAA